MIIWGLALPRPFPKNHVAKSSRARIRTEGGMVPNLVPVGQPFCSTQVENWVQSVFAPPFRSASSGLVFIFQQTCSTWQLWMLHSFVFARSLACVAPRRGVAILIIVLCAVVPWKMIANHSSLWADHPSHQEGVFIPFLLNLRWFFVFYWDSFQDFQSPGLWDTSSLCTDDLEGSYHTVEMSGRATQGSLQDEMPHGRRCLRWWPSSKPQTLQLHADASLNFSDNVLLWR